MLKINKINFSYVIHKPILENISFTVKPGEFIGLVGPNGSGKTTLLRLLAGFLSVNSGEIWLDGKKIQKYSFKEKARRVAVVPQYHLVNQFFTVQELAQLGREPYLHFFKRLSKSDQELIDKMLKKLEVFDFKNRLLKTLSGGELQRVLIAKALIQETPIIIMDEPTNHLDIHHQIEVLQLIKEYQKNGRTILAVFHDLNFAAKFSDKILVLDKKIKAFGSPAEVLTEHILKEVFHTDAFAINKDLRVVLK